MNRELFYPPRIFAAIPSPYADLETSQVVIVPVPYDSTTEYRGVARAGPQAIIDASQDLELYDIELDREVYRVGIHTMPEVQPAMSGPEQMVRRVYEVAKDILDQGKMVVMLGGEHSLTSGMVKAFSERFEGLSVLQLDAHTDLRNEYLGTRYSHACVMRRVLEICPIVQVGIRSLSQEEHEFLVQEGMQPFYAPVSAFDQAFLDEVISSLPEKVYITIDLDILDPSIMSAVGTPEPGGMGWYEVLSLLRAVARSKRIVGFDLVEFCPKEGPASCAFLAAKLAYKLIGYATSPSTSLL